MDTNHWRKCLALQNELCNDISSRVPSATHSLAKRVANSIARACIHDGYDSLEKVVDLAKSHDDLLYFEHLRNIGELSLELIRKWAETYPQREPIVDNSLRNEMESENEQIINLLAEIKDLLGKIYKTNSAHAGFTIGAKMAEHHNTQCTCALFDTTARYCPVHGPLQP